MSTDLLLDSIPLWGLFLLTIALVFASVEAGYRFGGNRRRKSETEKEVTVGAIIGATLGLLAFMLAFTFGLAASRFDARRVMVVDEANAIGTAYLRAGLFADPHRTEIRELLRRYVDVRLQAVQTGDTNSAMKESIDLQNQLWPHAEALSQADPHSISIGLFVQSLNEVIDLHSKRVLIGVRNRLPLVIWIALYLVAGLSMALIGYQTGLVGSRRSPALVPLVLTFSIVILLILDLDRPREGMMRVSQQAMIDLQQSIAPSTENSQSK